MMLTNTIARCRRAASSASSAAAALPPLHSLDGRYASAYFNAAAKSGALVAAEADVARLRAAFAETPLLLRHVFENPSLPRPRKLAAIDALSSTLRLSPPTTSLLRVMMENARLPLVSAVLDSFSMLVRANRQELSVNVTSATPLDARTMMRLQAAIVANKAICASPNIKLTNTVNPAILGGMVLELGESTIDMSASSRLAKIERALLIEGM